ncbi:cell division protein FtsZ [Euryarchaeota archaeon ex4484_162]|nr:cell division protein FtsZ [Thermoplasmata archaeon]OYT58473.1 MAG: cell division protein FtsZ [Euryarchaeota archaeon ex4484_162]RLF62459.1 MAG: cell division protein FtsZ [Thermoplasmata archaeon]HDM25291.1 cell division protein FtsZ [Thermoplasmatales archaeon]
MQTLVENAIEHKTKEEEKLKFDDDLFGEPKIVIVGCGGAGGNTVTRLHRLGVKGAETIVINTDKQALDLVEADKKLLIGKSITKGLGAGGFPEIGERAARESAAEIEELLKDANLVFITAGMGGGTGTGSAPVVAEIAKKQNAIVTCMVSTPFNVERARLIKADAGLDALRKKADSVVVLDNNRLLDFVPNLPINQAFSVMDQLIAETVKGISETITLPSLINLDFADMKAIMDSGGLSVMLWGEAEGDQGVETIVKETLNHPLLNVDYTGATGALVHITGGPNMSLKYVEEVAKELTKDLDCYANVILGARVLPEFEGKCRVMAIMTGVQSPNLLGPSGREILDSMPRKTKPSKLSIDFIS